MNYTRIYEELISNRVNRPSTASYTEVHHILPRSLGGSDWSYNLVKLSGREHYIAHRLLYKIHNNLATAKALNMMTHYGNSTQAREYAVNREANIKAMSEHMQGEGNHFFGKHHTDETKAKIRAKLLGKKQGPLSEATKLKMSESAKGKVFSPYTLALMRKAKLGKPLTTEHKANLAKAAKLKAPMTQSTKDAISKSKLGKPRSEETKLKLSKAHTGKKLTEEHKKALSKQNRANSKMVRCVETGVVYECIIDVVEKLHYPDHARSAIGSVCRGERHTARGLHWEFV